MTYLILAYLTGIWFLSKRDRAIADALAMNWLVCQAAVIMNDGFGNLPFFVLADFLTGLWLALRVQGMLARRVSLWFLPMIALNAAAYAAGGHTPHWHHEALAVLAWLQLATAYWGAYGLVAVLDHPISSLRNFISGTVAFVRRLG